MTKIILPKHTLSDLYMEEIDLPFSEQSDWYKILSLQSSIDVICSGHQDWLEDDPLFIFSMNNGVSINQLCLKDDVIDDTLFENFPNGMFFLDVTDESALRFQKRHGVICQSTSNPDVTILTQPSIVFTPEADEGGYGWPRVLDSVKGVPSNSLLLIDRYLFANDSDTKHSGEDNLFSILSVLLPDDFGGEYTVAIVVEYEQIRNGVTFPKLATRVNKMKSKLHKKYQIDIELIALKKGSRDHSITHNRQVLTNNFIVKAEHKFNAFNSTRSICSQDIAIQRAYSSGIDGKSDPPAKSINKTLKLLKQFIQWWKEHPDTTDYEFAKNGNSNVTIEELSNKLLLA